MGASRIPTYRKKSPKPASGERNAWYARPPHDELSSHTFFNSRVRLTVVCPETALMYAVLEEAFLCLQKTGELTPLVRRQAREAEQWFFSDDSRSVFSFLNICDALGLDPGYTRKKLKRGCRGHLDSMRTTR